MRATDEVQRASDDMLCFIVCEWRLFVMKPQNLDLADFRERWRRARTTTLLRLMAGNPVIPGSASSDTAIDPSAEGAGERGHSHEYSLVVQVPAECQAVVLKGVFDVSRLLGLSLTRHLGHPLDVKTLSAVIRSTDLPCFVGTWSCSADGQARVLSRVGCGQRVAAFTCDYWREAADGLVMGAGDDARFTRHASLGHGQSVCTDWIFPMQETALRWGPVPPEISTSLAKLLAQLEESGVQLHLDGFVEGTLFYRLENAQGSVCGPGGKLLTDLVTHESALKCPGIQWVDVSARAVL